MTAPVRCHTCWNQLQYCTCEKDDLDVAYEQLVVDVRKEHPSMQSISAPGFDMIGITDIIAEVTPKMIERQAELLRRLFGDGHEPLRGLGDLGDA